MKLLLLALLTLAQAAPLAADTVTLGDGTKVTGTIAMETPGKIAVKLADGSLRIIRRQDIAAVERDAAGGGGGAGPAAAAATVASSSPSSTDEDLARFTIKVTATVRRPDFFKPWDRLPPKIQVGSGYLQETHGVSPDGPYVRHEVITSASLVAHATEIQLQASGSSERVGATVTTIYPDLDLAVVKADAPIPGAGSPSGVSHLGIDHAPMVGDWLKIYGYTVESNNVSSEDAAITHIDYEPVAGPSGQTRHWLNAGLRSGFAGGLAAYGPYPVGIVVEAGGRACMISWDVLGSFATWSAGPRLNKPYLAQSFLSARNPALRAYLHLPPSAHGILVEVPGPGAAGQVFKEWDLATAIGDDAIDDDGLVRRDDGLRISYGYRAWTIQNEFPRTVVENHRAVVVPFAHPRVKGSVPLTVRRDGQSLDLQAPLTHDRPMLLRDLGNGYPPYFIYGPVVFSVASRQLLAAVSLAPGMAGALGYRGSPLVGRLDDEQSYPGEELVIVSSPFFPHRLAKGYGDARLCVVRKVNGTTIRNLQHLVEVLRDSRDEFIDIEFADRLAEEIVFPRAEMVAATDSILADNDVRSQGSPELLAVWKHPPAAGP